MDVQDALVFLKERVPQLDGVLDRLIVFVVDGGRVTDANWNATMDALDGDDSEKDINIELHVVPETARPVTPLDASVEQLVERYDSDRRDERAEEEAREAEETAREEAHAQGVLEEQLDNEQYQAGLEVMARNLNKMEMGGM